MKNDVKVICTAADDAFLPVYSSAGAAGADLRACIDADILIRPGERTLVPTGVCIQLPCGYEAQIRPRSGLALKFGITLANALGTIDSDYRGEIKVILINLGTSDFVVKRKDRIAQIVVAPVTQCLFERAESLDDTDRGTCGFGSTGV